MRERVAALLGGATRFPLGQHVSFGLRANPAPGDRRPGDGYDRNFSILDESDALSTILRGLVDDGALAGIAQRRVRPHADRSSQERGAASPRNSPPAPAIPRTVALAEVYRLYQERLRAINALDFGDLLLLTYRLFERDARRARALAGTRGASAGRRVPGHQPRAVPAGARAVGAAPATCAWSATRTSRSTAGAAPTSATSSTSSATSRRRRSSSWSRTTARPRPSSPPPAR